MITVFKDDINKFINIPGSFVTYTSPKFVNVTKIDSYWDDLDLNGAVIERLISTSTDEINWTPWQKITNTLEIAGLPVIYFKIMWRIKSNPDFGFVDVRSLKITITDTNKEKTPSKDSIAEYSQMEKMTFKISEREVKLNKSINKSRGILVNYYRTLPDLDSKDVILNEYSIKGVVECKKINVVVEVFPDQIPNYDEYGINVEKFEAFIDYHYFKDIFGDDAKPRIEDRIYFSLSNILYYVHSAYLLNGIREKNFTWMLSLLKHTEDADMVVNPLYEKIKEMTVTKEDLFGEEILEEMTNAKNTDQTTKSKKSALRAYTSNKISFVPEKLDTNGNVVFNNCVDVNTTELNPLIYRKIDKIDKNYSISFLFKYTGNSTFIKDDTNTISIVANKLQISGVEVDTTLQTDKWYGVIINFYEKNCEVNIWKTKTSYRSKVDTGLDLVTSIFVSKKFFLKKVMLGSGTYKLGNLRIWRLPVSMEYQSFVLTSRLVEKPAKTFIIDNYDPDVHLYNYGLDITT